MARTLSNILYRDVIIAEWDDADLAVTHEHAARVEIVERAMRAIKDSRPRPFDPLELQLFQHALDIEFGL